MVPIGPGVCVPDGFVTCDECHGRRRMDYPILPKSPVRASAPTPGFGTSVLIDGTIRIESNQPCRTCKGVGYVKGTKPLEVLQRGRVIGTVPPSFNPSKIKSTNWLYDPRPGDFVRQGDQWVASGMLGPGDLEAVPGFVWRRG